MSPVAPAQILFSLLSRLGLSWRQTGISLLGKSSLVFWNPLF